MLACLVDGEPSTSRTVIASQLCDRAYGQRGEREVFEHWRAQLKWHAQTARKIRHDDRLPLDASLPTTSQKTRSRWVSARREAGCSGTMAFSSAVHAGLQPGVALALALWPTVSGVQSPSLSVPRRPQLSDAD